MSRSHQARKRFGQHFLSATSVINDIVESIAPNVDDTLVEIGPGHGAITVPLADTGARLHAVEFDRDLVSPLRDKFAGYDNVTIHEADALKFDFASLGPQIRVVGNLPYNISTPLLFRLIDFKDHIRDLHFMLQKEVVDRMAAAHGNRSYGRLTIMLGCHMQVQPLFDVPPESFTPPPKVMSSVVALRPQPDDVYQVSNNEQFASLVVQAFTKRRKTVRNALRGVASEDQLASAGIDPGTRPEQISIAQWVTLANNLSAKP